MTWPKLFIPLLGCILPLMTHLVAQDSLDQFLDEESEIERDLVENQKIFKDLNQLDLQKTKIQRYKLRNETRQSKREEDWKTTPFRAVLKKGSWVENLETGKSFKSKDDQFVWAQEIIQGSQLSYILNADKAAHYQVKTLDLVPIEQDLTLTPETPHNIIYDEPTKLHSTDKTFPLTLGLNLDLAGLSDEYYSHFFSLEALEGKATRFSFDGMVHSFLPFTLGLSLMFESGNMTFTDTSLFEWDAFYYGAKATGELFSFSFTQIELSLSVYRSINYQGNLNSIYDYQFSNTMYQFGLHGLFETSLGGWILGVQFGSQRPSLKENLSDRPVFTSRRSYRWTALNLGYKIDLNL